MIITVAFSIITKPGLLDDGTQSDTLSADPSGGGFGNSQAEKPWVIIFQPYLKSRQVAFCPSEKTPKSRLLTTDMNNYNGGATDASQGPTPNSELAIAETEHTTIQSYLLNSIY